MTLLEKARSYEKENVKKISDEERPVYHLSPATGWLNDPNGFSFYNGKYHLFYQYNPYSTRWDAMHWGHWTSEDLLKWKAEPAAMAPDMPYETGCFSGSAMTYKDGRHLIMYTAHNEFDKENGEHFREETQCIAFGDGKDYVRYEKNPVLTVKDLPEGSYAEDFRDPKIWYEDGKYYCVAAVRMKDGLGSVLLFESEDALKWTYSKELLHNDGSFGDMWECPDMFELDGKRVISFSAMNMRNTSPLFRNGNCTLFCVKEDGSDIQAMDLGFDFYAPQSTLTKDGRRIVTAWMQAPESGGTCPDSNKWFGQMTFPRELTLKSGHVYQKPIDEIASLYERTVEKEFLAETETEKEEIRGRAADMTVIASANEDFCLKFAAEGDIYTSIEYRSSDRHLILNRSHAGRGASICDYREILTNAEDKLELRLLLDKYSFEIFVNGGYQALTGTLYETPLTADHFIFKGGKDTVKVKFNSIKSESCLKY